MQTTTTKLYLFLLWLTLGLVAGSLTGYSQTIRGTVFRDFNADGVYTALPASGTYAYGEPGVGGIVVTAHNAAGAVVATTTSSSLAASLGSYTLTVGNTSVYRIEFTNLAAGDYDSFRGINSGTSVQFVTGGTTNVNLGINYPTDYCQPNPSLIVPCYVNGDPTSTTGNAGSQPILLSLPYSSTGTTPSETILSPNNQVGTVYGVAYQRDTKLTFTAAYVKRHSGLGSTNNPGTIYLSKPGSGTTYTNTSFATIPNAGTVLSNTARGLTGITTDQNRDPSVFGQVGKAGLGDLEISDDGSQLYVVNLNDRKLYQVGITNFTTTSPTAGSITSYTIPTPALGQATGSVFRPFGLKYYRGKLYVGGVTTNEAVPTSTTVNFGAGSTGGNLITRDTVGMKAAVFVFDPVAGTFNNTPVLSFPLTYKKGGVNNDKTGVDRADRWLPWTDIQPGFGTNPVPSRFARADLANCSYPQAMLAGIEFDVNGNMIISLRDRFGDQYGNNNLGPNVASGTQAYRAIGPGDLLQAGKCNPAVELWTIESNARICNGTPTAGANNGEGFGGGEYYFSDAINAGNPFHNEMSEGGLARLPGTDEVASVALDPVFNTDAGGIRRFKVSDGSGSPATSVEIYYSGSNVSTYGKANGLGDLELTCNASPIQIGNRVWTDTNNNGVQDPGEPALAGVTVTLRGPGLPTAGVSVTTNSNGEYYFSDAAGTNTTGFVYSLTGLTNGAGYTLSFPASFSSLVLSARPNSATGTNADAIDTDPDASGVISFTLGQFGQNNFTYDAGYVAPAQLGDFVFEDVNANGQQEIGIDKPIQGVVVTLVSNGTVVATTTTNASGLYSFTGLTPSKPYSVSFTTPAGFTATTPNTGNDATDSDPVGGITAPVTLTAGQNNPDLDAGFFRPATLGDQVFVDLDGDGIQNNGETGLGGVIVTLVVNGSAVATATTNPDGTYSFTGLTPGVPYSVSFTAPTGYTASTFPGGVTAPVTLTSGQTNNTLDAGFQPRYDLSLAKTVLSPGPYYPGSPITYRLTVTNNSVLPAYNVALSDQLPTGVSFVSGTGFTTSGVNSVSTLLSGPLAPAGGTASLTLTVSIGSGYVASSVVNNAAITRFTATTNINGPVGIDTNPANNTATASAPVGMLASLGDQTFIDTNGDGIQNNGELPIGGVIITLISNGSVVATTTSNASGVYSFTGLTPGVPYSVSFTAPTGYTASTYPGGVTAPVTLIPGQNNTSLDAGFTLIGVYDVAIAKSVLSSGPYYPGSSITYQITVTNNSNKPVYNVTVVDNLPAGQTFTGGAGFTPTGQTATATLVGPLAVGASTSLTLSAQVNAGFMGANLNNSVAITKFTATTDANGPTPTDTNPANNTATASVPVGMLASLGDQTFIDTNGDGIQNNGELPIAGVVITLISNGSVVATTTSNASGVYSFTGLTPGVPYSVSFTAPTGYTASTFPTGVSPVVSLTSGQNNTTLDAGFTLIPVYDLSLAKTVLSSGPYYPGSGQVTFRLTVTNSSNVPVYNVVLNDVLPAGISFVSGTGFTTSGANSVSALLSGPLAPAGGTASLTLTVSIGSGYVASSVVNNAAITRFTATTNINGPIGIDTNPANNTATATVPVGMLASLGDQTFIDTNGDGIQNNGELPIGGVIITLISNGSVVATTTSNASGVYSFTGLTPGVPYSVSFTAPTGYTASTFPTGVSPVVSLTSGQNNTTLDAGFTLIGVYDVAIAKSVLSSGPYYPGSSITYQITVTNNSNKPVYNVTVVDNLPAGQTFTGGAGFTPTGQTATATLVGPLAVGASTSLTLSAQVNAGFMGANLNNSVAITKFTATTDANGPTPTDTNPANNTATASVPVGMLASLGDQTFIDTNGDGIQNNGELPIAGVIITLISNGSVVATTTSNASGVYSFTGLTPGVPYSVSFTAPTGYTASTYPGGVTAPVTLTPGQNNTSLDAGFVRLLPTYAIAKTVDIRQVEKGQIVTYTLSLTNTSTVSATSLVITDQLSSLAVAFVGSATASTGTFTPGGNSGNWSIPSLGAGQVATLSFRVQLNEEGITYNTVTAPDGQTATVCTTVPFHVCANEPFEFLLTVPNSYTAYQWSRNGQPIPGATTNTLSATAVGEYTVTGNGQGGCPSGSCCPFIVVADPVPSLTALAVSAQCVGVTPQSNAAITMAGSNSLAISYNITKGSSFTASVPLFGSPQALSAVVGGVLLGGQPNPALAQDYTIRVYAANGCFSDTVVTLLPAVCNCPPAVCTPVVVRKTKSQAKPIVP